MMKEALEYIVGLKGGYVVFEGAGEPAPVHSEVGKQWIALVAVMKNV